jgi:serine/threonine protein kinase
MAGAASGQSVGRYVLYDQIASGGMATVHMGRLIGPVGFSRVVAVKRLHPMYAQDAAFVAMMIDEARLASRVRHPNVVPILDVVASDNELLLVMEYVQGETLARLQRMARRGGEGMAPDIAVAVLIDTLRGLHAAHEAKNAAGEPLGIVHRDVSPQNVMVGTDGSARLLDFGVAKAASRSQSTEDGQLKGKLGYVAPEQISGGVVDRRVDIFAASIVGWECIAGRRLFEADDMIATLARVADAEVPSLRGEGFDIPEALEAALLRGLAAEPNDRFQTAEEMARAVEAALRPASRETVGAWVQKWAGEALDLRAATMQRIETAPEGTVAEVSVGISPDQSGKISTLRASVGSGTTEDGGTFPSTLQTVSIRPAKPAPPIWRRAAILILAALAAAALVVGAFVLRGGQTVVTSVTAVGAPSVSTAPVAEPPPVESAPEASASAEPAAEAPSASAEPSASVAAAPVPRPAAPPRSSHPTTKKSAAPPASAPLPVDPLIDQR